MKPARPASEMTASELARYIDHSVLKPELTPDEVRRETAAAIRYGCRTVCVNPASVAVAAELCAGTDTGVCVVADFPFGCSSTSSKVAQAEIAIASGATELDVVAGYGWLRAGLTAAVEEDLRPVVERCHEAGVLVKVILETDALTMEQVRTGVDAAVAAGADFVKTSTGFYTGATQHDRTGAFDEMVQHLMTCAAGRCQVKGSGGIRDRDHFLRLVDLGVDRVGIGYRSTPVVLGLAADGVTGGPVAP